MLSYYLLNPSVIAEPLVNNWYAWINLISPLTYSRYLQHHVKLMESYLQAPHIHQQANTEIRLRGGTFLDFKGAHQINMVSNLIKYTKEHCKDLASLSIAIDILNEALKKYKKIPYSFNDEYDKLPKELKGFVELVYDVNNNPAIRFIEPMFYKSSYYKPDLQSILLYHHDPDDRIFALSTPRLNLKNSIEIRIPFNSEFYDHLFKARKTAISLSSLKSLYDKFLLDTNITFDMFKSFFLTVKKNENQAVKEIYRDKFIIKYFGHACVLLESSDCNILVDPLISYDSKNNEPPRFLFSDLPDQIDYVIITHAHQDHAVLETLLQIRYKIKNIVVPTNNKGSLQDPSLKLALKQCGFNHIHELSEFDSIKINGGEITSIPFLGEHADLDIRSKCGYLIKLQSRTILFLADSKNIDNSLYEHMAKFLPKIDIIFIGLECIGAPLSWLYGPLILSALPYSENHSRRLNGSNKEEGYAIIRSIGCKEVYIYAMAFEPWLTFISNLDINTSTTQIEEAKKLVQLCEKNGIKAEMLYGSRLISF